MPIHSTRAKVAGAFAAALMLTPASLSAQETQYHGMILSRDESTLTVRTTAGDKTLRIDPDTKIQAVAGAVGLRRKNHTVNELVRGLAIDFTATATGDDEYLAKEITFKPSSLKTARQIEAGLHETEGRVAANKAGIEENADRIDNIGDYEAAGRAKAFFDVGSAQLNEQAKQDLKALAEQAKGIKGYRLAVVGRADPTGNAAANQRLSERRAAAVKGYLLESCGVLPGRIVPNTAIGASKVVDDPDAPQTNAEARRVTVTILVSKSART